MKTKLIIMIVVLLAGAGAITVVSVRVQQQTKEEKARQKIQNAPTNITREMKPLTEPPIFPEKKK
jgi:flagellar basal body-associated protein FliL